MRGTERGSARALSSRARACLQKLEQHLSCVSDKRIRRVSAREATDEAAGGPLESLASQISLMEGHLIVVGPESGAPLVQRV